MKIDPIDRELLKLATEDAVEWINDLQHIVADDKDRVYESTAVLGNGWKMIVTVELRPA